MPYVLADVMAQGCHGNHHSGCSMHEGNGAVSGFASWREEQLQIVFIKAAQVNRIAQG